MKAKYFFAVVLVLSLILTVATPGAASADGGFDQFGFNRTARLFNGAYLGWCMGNSGWTEAACRTYLGPYADDKIIMKWNAEWDRGIAEKWSNPPYDARMDNQFNGAFPGGSGAVWLYKIVWVGNCVADRSLVPAGAWCVWKQFAAIMDQGKDPNIGPGHFWFAHANPTGYGVYP